MLSYNLREIALDHSEQRCVLRIGFCQEHIVIIVVLIVKHTQSIRKVDSRFD